MSLKKILIIKNLTTITQYKKMKKLNKAQIIGIGLFVLAVSASFLTENNFIGPILGILSACGIGLVFKWIPFRKRNLTE
jgi:multisubunit Na+/H+ antiporter MnhG subunit